MRWRDRAARISIINAPRAPNPIATDLRTQEELLAECRSISGIALD
jgi:hypothetical protein